MIDEEDLAELAIHACGASDSKVSQIEEDDTSIDSAMQMLAERGVDWDQWGECVKLLLPMTIAATSPLTGDRNHVMGKNMGECFIAHVKMPATNTKDQ